NGVTYDALTGKITVPAGVSSFAVTVPTVDDTIVEPNETLTLTVSDKSGVGTIIDNDLATVVKVDPVNPTTGSDSVVEGKDLTYTVTLSATTNKPTTFDFKLGAPGDTASTADYSAPKFNNGVTYDALTGKITVPAGVSSFAVTVPTVDDTIVEPNETLTLTVSDKSGV
ncbi:Calx-beta domain-containing protein, partial [Methylophilus luteus]